MVKKTFRDEISELDFQGLKACLVKMQKKHSHLENNAGLMLDRLNLELDDLRGSRKGADYLLSYLEMGKLEVINRLYRERIQRRNEILLVAKRFLTDFPDRVGGDLKHELRDLSAKCNQDLIYFKTEILQNMEFIERNINRANTSRARLAERRRRKLG